MSKERGVSYTIEPEGDGEYYPITYIVYEWDVFPQYSVLAGQESKTHKKAFETVAEALKAFPDAEVEEQPRKPYNYVDHLPDWEMSARDEEVYDYPNEYP